MGRRKQPPRMKRAHLRPYSIRRATQPNPIEMGFYNARAQSNYPAWLDELFPGKQALTEADANKWQGVKPRIIYNEKKLLRGIAEREEFDTCNPRLRVILRLRELAQSDRLQHLQDYNAVCIREGKRLRVWMCFSGDRFFFIEINAYARVMSRSIIYKGRERAEQVFRDASTTWEKTVAIPDDDAGEIIKAWEIFG